MKTQKELGRKDYVMDAILFDKDTSLDDEIIELQEIPESYINCIYDVSYDEMTSEEIKESIKEAKYDKLYKDLNSTNVLEKREELITDFYTVNLKYTGKSNIMDLLQKLV